MKKKPELKMILLAVFGVLVYALFSAYLGIIVFIMAVLWYLIADGKEK